MGSIGYFACHEDEQMNTLKRNVTFILGYLALWTLPSTNDTFGFDGSQWIIEAVDHGAYHLVDRWTPEESSPVGRIGRELLYLSGMRIWCLY